MIFAMLRSRRSCLSWLTTSGICGSQVPHSTAKQDHHGDHDPVCVLTHKRATRDKGVSDDPDVEEHQEVVDEEVQYD